MKKAKRLLAVVMAFVMVLSAACVNVYAFNDSNNYLTPSTSRAKYYLNYEQGAGWLLDKLDGMLAEKNMTITCDELNEMADIGLNIFTSNILLDLDDELESSGNPKGLLDLRSVDGIIRTLDAVLNCLDGNWIIWIGDAIGIIGDLLDSEDGLNKGGFQWDRTRSKTSDAKVLEMLIDWLSNQRKLLAGLVAGTFNMGSLLEGLLEDVIGDALGYTGGSPLKNLDYAIQTLLYGKLIDDSVTEVSGTMLDEGVQKLVNWALIEGTGVLAEEGGKSILGENFEPLMGESLAAQPGGASLTGVPIMADHDLDGVPEAHTMSFYQLVNNVIRALLDEMVVPMLTEVLCDALDVEITEDQPYGDPEVLTDQMFTMIVGLVESLLVQNGAPEPVYTDEQNTYPLLKIEAMLDWLFNKGGLDTILLIDYQGIHIQDNLMSLLNDLIRILVNMLPSLGLFEDSAHLGFEGDELTAIWYYADTNPKTLVAADDETAVDQTYITYETGDILYATQYEEINGVTKATAYNYVANDMPVNIADKNAAGYANPDFIRPNYVVETDKVYATVIKMALNDIIDGCYFPEWADDIPSVLAYAMAGLASQALPQNNYYARLDAYHKVQQAGGIGVVTDGNNNEIDPIPYTSIKRISHKDIHGNVIGTEDVTIPSGALDIGCSYLAAYLNNVLMLNKSAVLSTDTTFEKFLTQFITWALDQYMPVLVGYDTNGNGVYGESGEYPGLWTANFNNLISTVYSDVSTLTFKADVEQYTSQGVQKIDAIYDLLDATLFALIPTSWLPDINGSAKMINGWLLNNLIEFDLIGILDLLSVNMDYENGELNKPALTVILRVIDRVLALVFNGNSVLIPTRNNVLSGGGSTSVTTLSELLSSKVNGSPNINASLPQFIYRLLEHLNTYKYELLATALPLLANMDYMRSFKEDGMLETSMKNYKLEDLENYISDLSDNINATLIIEKMADRDTAEGIVNGDFQVKRNAEGTAYDLIITTNNVVYGSYATKVEADAVVASFKNTYLEEVVVTEGTIDTEPVYAYNIWREWSYIEAAKTETTETDENGSYSKFTDFKFSNITNRTTAKPFVSYEKDQFKYLRYEDLGAAGYLYTGANDALDDASDFVSSYRGFAESDLSNAYHDWFMYSVESQLYNVGKLDLNNDGVVNDEDGTPGIPGAMYPFYTTTSKSYEYTDYYFGATESGFDNRNDPTKGPTRYTNTIDMAEMNEANYDQLALALELGADPRYDVEFSREEVEAIVRLALSATDDFDCLQFDIIPDGRDAEGNLTYNGMYQWEDLSVGHLNTIAAWLRSRNLEYKVVEDSPYGDVEYTFTRPRFAYIDTSNILVSGASSIPVTASEYAAIMAKDSLIGDSQMTYADEVNAQIYLSYCEYIKALYDNREALYDNIDLISYRHEEAEKNRSKAIDTTMLEWAKNTFADAYMGNAGRNKKYDGYENGALKTTNVYTTSSYQNFRIAYDYAVSLIEAAANSLLSDDELTQSMASEAFYGLLEAYYQLVDYTGEADWTQLEAYMELAQAIIDDPLSYDANVGYNMEDGQWNIMLGVLGDSINLKADEENIDCERQTEVDDMASALYQAIYKLSYLTNPDLKSSVDTSGNDLIGTVVTSSGSARITGQVFGLEEGIGAIMELIQIVGMREDEASGTKVSITGSGRGVGTGAYYIGTVENRERFRYYAVVYGDINGDTRVDGTDVSILEIALMTSDGALTQEDLGSAAKFEAADVNHDGFVDPDDIDGIVDHYTFVSKIDQREHSTTVIS